MSCSELWLFPCFGFGIGTKSTPLQDRGVAMELSKHNQKRKRCACVNCLYLKLAARSQNCFSFQVLFIKTLSKIHHKLRLQLCSVKRKFYSISATNFNARGIDYCSLTQEFAFMANSKGNSQNLVQLSKRLSWILRHGAKDEGLQIGEDGFANVNDVLQCKSFRGVTQESIKEVVESNDKQRFAISTCPKTGQLQIRANQGHSFQVNHLQLKPILNGLKAPLVIHGTTRNNWDKIKNEGLSRMNRIHIHFAAAEPNSKEVISGARSSSKVLIYIDIDKAQSDGILFYRSANNVILSPGDARGFISPKYFKKVTFIE